MFRFSWKSIEPKRLNNTTCASTSAWVSGGIGARQWAHTLDPLGAVAPPSPLVGGSPQTANTPHFAVGGWEVAAFGAGAPTPSKDQQLLFCPMVLASSGQIFIQMVVLQGMGQNDDVHRQDSDFPEARAATKTSANEFLKVLFVE